jgi:hypothetical protein
MSTHDDVLAELDRRELPIEDYQRVWEELNLPAPRDLPERPPAQRNLQAEWWEHCFGKPIPPLT